MAITISGSGITSANIADGTIVNADINSSAAIAGSKLTGAGKVLQVVSTTKTDTFSTTSTSFVDVTGLSTSITPSATSSKILVSISVSHSMTDTHNTGMLLRLLRGATVIAGGTSAGSRPSALMRYNCATSSGGAYVIHYSTNVATITYLDSPSTTASTTYKVDTRVNGSSTMYINRTGFDGDSTNYPRTASTITLTEIGA
jgi:hypothetical protein